ncbi:MAG: FtsH protease activity modulator HflK [Pseudomonadota bacterium]
MPWSNQGGGGWKANNNGGGPWGQGPTGGGSGGGGGGGGGQQPDLEEILKRSQDRFKQMGGGRGSWGLGALALVVGGLLFVGYLCFVTINPNEVGVKLRFGQFVGQLNEGLHLKLPDPFETVQKVRVTELKRTEVGFRNQNFDTRFRSSNDGFPEESLMLTGDENIVDLDFVVLWNIKSAPNYLFNIQQPEGTVKVVAESVMREMIGQRDIQLILTENRSEIEAEVAEQMQKTLDSYEAGINIVEVQMLRVDPPTEVIGAFRDVQAAEADKDRAQEEAKAYRNKIVPEARGEAERITQAAQAYKEKNIAEAQGKASRFEQVYNEYSKAPEVTRRRMYLETMERVFGSTDKIIIDNNGGAGGGVVPYLPLNELNRANNSQRRTQ